MREEIESRKIVSDLRRPDASLTSRVTRSTEQKAGSQGANGSREINSGRYRWNSQKVESLDDGDIQNRYKRVYCCICIFASKLREIQSGISTNV